MNSHAVEIINAFEPYVPYLIVALSTIVPFLIEYRRSRYALMEKKFEITYEHARGAMHRFTDAYLSCKTTYDINKKNYLQDAAYYAKIYFGPECRTVVDRLMASLDSETGPTDESDRIFDQVLTLFGEYLDSQGKRRVRHHSH